MASGASASSAAMLPSPAVSINRGQGPRRLDPEPATTGEPDFGPTRSGNNLIPFGIEGVGLIMGHGLDALTERPGRYASEDRHHNTRNRSRNLAGHPAAIPRSARRHAGRQINAIASRPAQDDTVTRRRSAERGDPCLHIIIGGVSSCRDSAMPVSPGSRITSRPTSLAPTTPATACRHAARTRWSPLQDHPPRHRHAQRSRIETGVPSSRRAVARPDRENPVDADTMNASRQIRRMVEMVPGLADPVAVIEQSALLARSRSTKDTPCTAGHSRSPLP